VARPVATSFRPLRVAGLDLFEEERCPVDTDKEVSNVTSPGAEVSITHM
jgi:hypothetical protein